MAADYGVKVGSYRLSVPFGKVLGTTPTYLALSRIGKCFIPYASTMR